MRRAKVLAGLDADAEVRLANYPGSSLLDYLRPRESSQPAAAAASDAAVALFAGAVSGLLDQSLSSRSSALWTGEVRF